MKKSFLLFAVTVMLMLTISVGYAPPAIFAAETISIQKIIEVVPPRFDTQHPNNSIAMQAVWDPKRLTWRRQVIPFNGATTEMVGGEMKKLAEQLVPDRIGIRDWESWKFTIIYPAEGAPEKIIAKSETVIASAKSTAMPLPKITPPVALPATPAPAVSQEPNLQTQINAIKANMARPPATTPPAKPAVVVKKQPVISPLVAALAECKTKAQGLVDEKTKAEKALGECQTALSKANADLKTANDNFKVAETAYATNLTKVKDALAKAEKDGYAYSTLIWFSIIFFVIGIIVGATITRGIVRSKKKTPATK